MLRAWTSHTSSWAGCPCTCHQGNPELCLLRPNAILRRKPSGSLERRRRDLPQRQELQMPQGQRQLPMLVTSSCSFNPLGECLYFADQRTPLCASSGDFEEVSSFPSLFPSKNCAFCVPSFPPSSPALPFWPGVFAPPFIAIGDRRRC